MTKALDTYVTRHTINTTTNRASRWHSDGAWPTADYFVRGVPDELRFATTGDVVEFVIVETKGWDYHGLVYTTSRIEIVGTVTV